MPELTQELPTPPPMLESALDPRLPRRRARRRVAVTGLGLALIAIGVFDVAALAPVFTAESPVRAPIAPAAVAPVVVTLPPTLVTVVETPPPAASAPAASTALACPVIDATEGDPIGVAITPGPRALDPGDNAGPPPHVVAAAHVPRLAILTAAHAVIVSDDDGATFRDAFVGHEVDELRIGRDGTLYARAGTELGVRAFPGRGEHWRRPAVAACEQMQCLDHVVTIDDRVVWLHSGELSTSDDRGASWHGVKLGAPWSDTDGDVFAWRGALYQVERYTDQCGVDDSPTWRFDASTGAVANTIFHNNDYEPGSSLLTTSDEVGTTWSWRERCIGDEPGRLGACSSHAAVHAALLAAKTLRPVTGARELAIYDNSLVELCGGGARQIYRAFPFDSVEAVDAHGRPLVVHDGTVLRWSTVSGWRRLYRSPPAPVAGD